MKPRRPPPAWGSGSTPPPRSSSSSRSFSRRGARRRKSRRARRRCRGPGPRALQLFGQRSRGLGRFSGHQRLEIDHEEPLKPCGRARKAAVAPWRGSWRRCRSLLDVAGLRRKDRIGYMTAMIHNHDDISLKSTDMHVYMYYLERALSFP